MPAPYSKDLRNRIISAYLKGQSRVSVLAKRYNVSPDTVMRYIQKHEATGSVNPEPHGGGRPAAIGIEQVDRLAVVLAKNPDATIKQMCVTYAKIHKISISELAMQRALKRFGITSKQSH